MLHIRVSWEDSPYQLTAAEVSNDYFGFETSVGI